jgi:hypothetical protein
MLNGMTIIMKSNAPVITAVFGIRYLAELIGMTAAKAAMMKLSLPPCAAPKAISATKSTARVMRAPGRPSLYALSAAAQTPRGQNRLISVRICP